MAAPEKAPPERILIKGTAPRAIVQFVIQNYGPDGLERVVQVLGEDARNMVNDGPLLVAWYDLIPFEEFIRAADRLLGQGDLTMPRAMGRFSAHFGMKKIYKIFLKVGSPDFVLNRASSIWKRYYSHGQLVARKTAPKTNLLTLQDFEHASDVFCPRITGWLEGVVELIGVKKAQVEHVECKLRNHPDCQWRITLG